MVDFNPAVRIRGVVRVQAQERGGLKTNDNNKNSVK